MLNICFMLTWCNMSVPFQYGLLIKTYFVFVLSFRILLKHLGIYSMFVLVSSPVEYYT